MSTAAKTKKKKTKTIFYNNRKQKQSFKHPKCIKIFLKNTHKKNNSTLNMK